MMKNLYFKIVLTVFAAMLVWGCQSGMQPSASSGPVAPESQALSSMQTSDSQMAAKPDKEEGITMFTYINPYADEVYITGDFNNWSKNATPMLKGDSGVFTLEMKLDPGVYQYKFVVDGDWITDPENPDTVPDGYGGKNSVIIVK